VLCKSGGYCTVSTTTGFPGRSVFSYFLNLRKLDVFFRFFFLFPSLSMSMLVGGADRSACVVLPPSTHRCSTAVLFHNTYFFLHSPPSPPPFVHLCSTGACFSVSLAHSKPRGRAFRAMLQLMTDSGESSLFGIRLRSGSNARLRVHAAGFFCSFFLRSSTVMSVIAPLYFQTHFSKSRSARLPWYLSLNRWKVGDVFVPRFTARASGCASWPEFSALALTRFRRFLFLLFDSVLFYYQ